jgi:uncharacterized protein (DUF1330 family)
MAAYFMNSYDIVDEQQFSQYAPQVIPLLQRYGAEVVAADVEGIAIEGKPRKMNAIIRFPSVESALKCYNDPEYQPMKAIRIGSTANCTVVLVKEFAMK